MSKRRAVALAVVMLVLGTLAYLQFRTWRHFDWGAFRASLAGLDPVRVLAGLALIYSTYAMRALRWKILLRPVKRVKARELIGTMVIGFTAVALLGRPGDLVRPYLLTQRHRELSLASQVAVLAVERMFDMACFALLLIGDVLFLPIALPDPHLLANFRLAGTLLGVAVLGLTLGLYFIWRSGDRVAGAVERRWGGRLPVVAHAVAEKIRTFSEGLHTIHDLTSFAQLMGLSLVIWLTIALAYVQVTHAYATPSLEQLSVPEVLLVMSASIAGSLLQLPMVGGGSQLGTISVLEGVLHVPREVAASCGLTLWLVTFMAIVPVGLIWARYEHVSVLAAEAAAEKEAGHAD